MTDTTWAALLKAEPLAGAPILFVPYAELPNWIQSSLGQVDHVSKQVPELDPTCIVVDDAGNVALGKRLGALRTAGTPLGELGPRNFGITPSAAWVDAVLATHYAFVCGYRDPFLAAHLATADDPAAMLWQRLVATELLGVARAYQVTRSII